MAVKLRLTRMGKKKQPSYRIVATDSHTKRDGEYIELIGTYNPLTKPATVKLDETVALKWLSEGAIPSDTVKNLFKEAGIMKKFADSKTKTHIYKQKCMEENNVLVIIDIEPYRQFTDWEMRQLRKSSKILLNKKKKERRKNKGKKLLEKQLEED